jgi:hypothetical protein
LSANTSLTKSNQSNNQALKEAQQHIVKQPNNPHKQEYKKKAKTHFLKIVTLNVNGLQLRRQPDKLHQMLTWMENEEIDVLLTPGLNANIKHSAAKEKINEVLRQHPGVKYITLQRHHIKETEYKPGGTAI